MVQGRPGPPRAVTSVRPKVALFTTDRGHRVHLLDTVVADWRKRDAPFYRATAVCGAETWRALLQADFPDDREFCDLCLFPGETPVVYQVHGAGDAVLYVGYTGRLIERADKLRREVAWWPEAVRISWTEDESTTAALDAELELIKQLMPPYNYPSGRRPWRSTPPKLRSRDRRLLVQAA